MSSELVRTTVNLTPKAHGALAFAAATEGLSRTDAVNRALQVYAQLVAEQRLSGAVVRLRYPDGRTEEITFEIDGEETTP